MDKQANSYFDYVLQYHKFRYNTKFKLSNSFQVYHFFRNSSVPCNVFFKYSHNDHLLFLHDVKYFEVLTAIFCILHNILLQFLNIHKCNVLRKCTSFYCSLAILNIPNSCLSYLKINAFFSLKLICSIYLLFHKLIGKPVLNIYRKKYIPRLEIRTLRFN